MTHTGRGIRGFAHIGSLRSSGLGPSQGGSSTGSESTTQRVCRMTKGVHEPWRDSGTPRVH